VKMVVTSAMPNEEPNFPGNTEGVEERAFRTSTSKTPDINENEAGAIEPRRSGSSEIFIPRRETQETDTPEMLSDSPLNQLVSLQPVLTLLLKTGGWTVAVLVAFRWVVIPLVTVNNPVSLTLAISVSIFLILSGITFLVRECKK
jgi:hypothetical protein